ncbi:BppU family phage baseplate upper protein [Listeria monocytogenes]|nr:DUF2479 domain-containing protein [Listeria monocytogenes]ELU8200252.1 BppU family phage baseplate upper protein [Listeria monocytogenes]
MTNITNVPIKLNLAGEVTDNPRVLGCVGDSDTITANITVVNGSEETDLTSWKLMFTAALPDGIHYIEDKGDAYNNLVVIEASSGRFDYTFTKETFSMAGTINNARFILYREDATLQSKIDVKNTCAFEIEIEPDALQGKISVNDFTSDIIKFEQEMSVLDSRIKEADENISIAENRIDNLEDEISASGVAKIADVVKKTGDTLTGTLQFDEIPTIFQAKQNSALWYRLTSENSTTYQQTSFPAIISGFEGIQGPGYNFKQAYLKLNDLDVETVAGSQVKADKALNDAKVYTDNKLDSYEAWTNVPLASGYSTGDSNTPQYRLVRKMTNEGSKTFAAFRGAIAGTFSSTANSTVGTMPVGTRPAVTEYFAIASNNGNGGRIAVLNDGKLLQVSSTDNANPSYVSLSGIYYEVE